MQSRIPPLGDGAAAGVALWRRMRPKRRHAIAGALASVALDGRTGGRADGIWSWAGPGSAGRRLGAWRVRACVRAAAAARSTGEAARGKKKKKETRKEKKKKENRRPTGWLVACDVFASPGL